MTDKNKKSLMMVILVVVALALGYSLNVFQFRSLFTGVGTGPSTSQQENDRSKSLMEQPAVKQAEQAPAAKSGEGQPPPSVPGQPDVASRDAKQTPPDAAPPHSAAAGQQEQGAKAVQPAEGGQPGQAGKEAPASAGADAAKQAPVYVVQTEAGPEAPSGLPKTLSDEKAARSAKIGRQVPAGAQTARGEEASGKEGTREMAAEKTEKAKHTTPQAETSGQDSGKAKGREKAEKTTGKIESGQAERPAAAKGGKVVEITAQDNPGEFVLTITTDGPVERVTSFYAKDPARLAVDLWGGWQASGPSVIAVNSPLVERIRTGSHPDKLRLVVDYRDKDFSGFSVPVVEKQDKGVVVRVPKNKTVQ